MRSILIVRLGALGDVVHAMPAVSALRRRWPDARIDWLVDPRYLEVVALVGGVNRAIAFDPRAMMSSEKRAATIGVLADLRRQHYDLAFDLQGLLKSATAARLAGARETVGFARAHLREPAARFFYTRVAEVSADVHVITRNLELVSSAGAPLAAPQFDLKLAPSAVVDRTVGSFGTEGYVAVNPGAGWPNKQWPAKRFGQLASAVHRAHGLRTLVVWGPSEESLAQTVTAASGGAAQMAPATGIVDLFGVLRAARLMIAGDTGPLHMATAVGTPVVALFGPTDSVRNGPWRDADISLSRLAACECHYERRCRRAVPCIDDISVDEVMQAVTTRLTRSHRGVAP